MKFKMLMISIFLMSSIFIGYVYSAGVFTNAPFSYGVFHSGGNPHWENNENNNMWNVRAWNDYNYWVLSWRATTTESVAYDFGAGTWVACTILTDANSQEAWFYIHDSLTTNSDPYYLPTTYFKISVARHLNIVKWQYRYEDYSHQNAFYGTIWQSNNSTYFNGRWEIYFEIAPTMTQYYARFRLYFTPIVNGVLQQQSAHLVSTWEGSSGHPALEWAFSWQEWDKYATLYTGISYFGNQNTQWVHFADVKIGIRVL